MKRLERILGRLTPKRWPVRWRLAAVSAALTLVILVIFAVVVGRLTSNRLQNDFNNDVRGFASTIAGQTQVQPTIHGPVVLPPSEVRSMAAIPANSAIKVVHGNGQPIDGGNRAGLPYLGHPDLAGVHRVGDLAIASALVPDTFPSTDPLFIQYARSTASLDSTISKLWLFLGLGVLGGTAARRPGGHRDRRPGDAPDRRADGDRPQDRHHPRPLASACRCPRTTTRWESWR